MYTVVKGENTESKQPELIEIVKRRFPLLQCYTFVMGERDAGYDSMTFPEGPGQISNWVDKRELIARGKVMMEKTKRDTSFLRSLVDECITFCEVLDKASANTDKEDFSTRPTYEIRILFSQFVDAYYNLARYMLLPHSIEATLSEELTDWLTTRLGDTSKAQQALSEIAIPSRESYGTKEKKDLLKIESEIEKVPQLLKKMQNGGFELKDLEPYPEIAKLVELHTKTYAWMSMVALTNAPFTEEAFLKSLSTLIGQGRSSQEVLESLEANNKNAMDTALRIQNELSMPEDVRFRVKMLQDFIFLRTFRMDNFGRAHYHIQRMLEEIAQRAGISMQEVKFLTPLEVRAFLETGRLIEREVIRKRMDAYGINVKDGVLEVFSGSEAEDVKKIELSKTEDLMEVKVKDSSIITRGSCASKGIVKGIARVILSPNEYQRFKQGDILITSMTTPDYSMILQNAAAIVTDEGGLTCHAAIISRELGIPCITGTKNATKRIADGEVIKVDADKGTVCREEME